MLTLLRCDAQLLKLGICCSLTPPRTSDCGIHVDSLLSMQDIGELIAYGESDWRTRGGVDAEAVLMAAMAAGLYVSPDLSMEVLRAELEARMEEQRAYQLNEDRPPPVAYTVRWYQENAHELISAESNVTVLQACFALAALKLRGGMTGQCLDSFCKLLSFGGLLGGDYNKMPKYALVHLSSNAVTPMQWPVEPVEVSFSITSPGCAADLNISSMVCSAYRARTCMPGTCVIMGSVPLYMGLNCQRPID